MTERIESIYKKKSHSKLKLILELLYTQYQRSRDEHISISELAKKIKTDTSNTRKSIKKMKGEGIIDVKYLEDVRGKKLYKLSKEAFNIIKKIKTAQ